MRIVEYETITCRFGSLKEGELYRESLGGAVYLKIFPADKRVSYGNCINLATNQLKFFFDDTDVFPVNGAFVENYKG